MFGDVEHLQNDAVCGFAHDVVTEKAGESRPSPIFTLFTR
jgi:hypothetical protein